MPPSPTRPSLDSGRVAIGALGAGAARGPGGGTAADHEDREAAGRAGEQCAPGRGTIYRTKLQLFEDWYQQHGANIAESVKALRELEAGAEGKEAYERLEKALAP